MADEDTTQDVAMLITAGRDREAARRGALLDGARPRSPGGHMDPVSQLGQLGPVLGGVIAGIRTDQLDEPTASTEMSVRGVLEHMIGGATFFAAAYRGDEPSTPQTTDPITGAQQALGELGAAISAPGATARTIHSPFGDMDGDAFARYIVLDGIVHGWDLATATDQAYDPPADVVAEADSYARQMLDPLRDGTTFAAAVEPPAGATPLERLVCYTGRRLPAGAR